jgi:uncharacterized protein (TIGR02118 family)
LYKLTLLFHKPDDPMAFETRWSEEFVPRAEKMPGIRRVAVSRVTGGLEEDVDLHLMHEFFFDDAEALREAMASPEGQSAGRTLMEIAGPFVSLFFSEHLEEERR